MTRKAVYDGPDGTVGHAELVFGNAMIMLGSQSNASPMKAMLATPAEIGGRVTSPMYLVVADCDPIYAKAKAAGAEIVQDLKTMDYGGRAFTVRDPNGQPVSGLKQSDFEIFDEAKPRAIAAPSPRAAPVTTANLPERSKSLLVSKSIQ